MQINTFSSSFLTKRRGTIVFHFNKGHLINPEIPMWVIKHKGQSYYVHHLDVDPGVGFSTKETPDNTRTKGSLKFKGNLSIEQQPSGETYARIFP